MAGPEGCGIRLHCQRCREPWSFHRVATTLAHVLFIAVAIAGLAFGQDAARAAISEELGKLLGPTGADFIKSILARSSDPTPGATVTAVGIVTVTDLLVDPKPGGKPRSRRRTGLHADRLPGRERPAVGPGALVCRQGRA